MGIIEFENTNEYSARIKVIGVGGAHISLDLLSQIVEEGFKCVDQGQVKKNLEWMPIHGIAYDPNLHVLAE